MQVTLNSSSEIILSPKHITIKVPVTLIVPSSDITWYPKHKIQGTSNFNREFPLTPVSIYKVHMITISVRITI